jgi:hypothetical protein
MSRRNDNHLRTMRAIAKDGAGSASGLGHGEVCGLQDGAVGGFQIDDAWTRRLRLLSASRARRRGRDEDCKDRPVS